MAIDYGKVRTGLAVTDPVRIIATALTTVETPALLAYIKDYCAREEVDIFVVGEAKHMDNTPSESMALIEPFVQELQKTFPGKEIARMDERFTSRMAFQTMIDIGLKKKDRQNKALVDKMSATIILQSYMESIKNQSLDRFVPRDDAERPLNN